MDQNPLTSMNTQQKCPHCGYCPTCGRSNQPVVGIYPQVPWYQPVYPVWYQSGGGLTTYGHSYGTSAGNVSSAVN